MIFEQSGIGTDASFWQATLVGLVNLVFTIVAMSLIDRIGRRPLLSAGLAGIALCMFLIAFGFARAQYTLTTSAIDAIEAPVNKAQLGKIASVTYDSDVEFKRALSGVLGGGEATKYQSELITAAISVNPVLILAGILGFVASFAVSLGPVMWVLFSELFPNRLRGLAVSFAGFINSAVSFLVQLVFPWELANIGNAATFLVFGVFAAVGLAFVLLKIPETKGKTLEQLERELVGA
jgi:MFS family permease